MTMTRNGIVYDLRKSPYIFEHNEFTYYFSSVNHKEKFLEKLRENRELINYSLSKRFGCNVDFNLLSDIVLYSKVETRGFLIKHKGDFFKCKKDIILNGEKATKKN